MEASMKKEKIANMTRSMKEVESPYVDTNSITDALQAADAQTVKEQEAEKKRMAKVSMTSKQVEP